jgi:RNA polymerase sigma factor (sigma-70 family)
MSEKLQEITKISREKEKWIHRECVEKNNCEPLVKQYWNLIRNTIKKNYKYSKRGDWESDVEDIDMNVFVNMFEKNKKRLRDWDPNKGSSLSSWICMITIQTVIDYIRDKKLFGPDGPEVTTLIEILGLTDQKSKLDFTDILNKYSLEKLLSKLSEKHCLVLKLYIMGYKIAEINDLLQIKNASEIKYRAILQLQKLIQDPPIKKRNFFTISCVFMSIIKYSRKGINTTY